MSHSEDQGEEPIDPELLDRFVGQLQSGELPDREKLLSQYPEAESLLDCLEGLERLAPERAAFTLDSGSNELTSPFPGQGSVGTGSSSVSGFNADLGDYELIEIIGRGGMGVVFRAQQKKLERTVAVKMIQAPLGASEEQLRRFRNETKAAAGLSHPNIVRIFDAGESNGQLYFAMQLIEGTSLAERLQQGLMKEAEAVQLVCGVARAVQHLHDHGIVHRDLKPSNILLDAEGRPYVTDFGLAKLSQMEGEATQTGVIAGTPSYMAPEQASPGRTPVGPAADVYSLGALLYELLTGRPPFRENSPLDTILRVLDGDPTPPRRIRPQISSDLENICLKCLEKSPTDRYASAEALADDLQRHLKGEPVETDTLSAVGRTWRWVRREPALAMRIFALFGFFLVQQFNFNLLASSDEKFNTRVTIILALWVILSLIAQRLIRLERWRMVAGFVWGTVDTALLTLVLWIANSVASPLIVGYPLLIVGAGLWFRVRLVWYMTALCTASYVLLATDYYKNRADLQSMFDIGFDHHVIYVVGYFVIGAITAYQVYRVRSLTYFSDAANAG